MRDKRKEYPDDDGRTIADMNVEGMPWFDPRKKSGFVPEGVQRAELTPAQRRRVIWGALCAVGLVMLVFGVVFFLAILGMDLAWR